MKTRTFRHAALLGAAGLLLAVSGPSRAQPPSSPPTLDMREADASWVKDPHVYEFYQLTVAAFAGGPAHVDRAAYERRSHQIFRALAVSQHISPDAFEKHASDIPGQMIEIVTRDPKTLANYDTFVVALFGPQPSSGG